MFSAIATCSSGDGCPHEKALRSTHQALSISSSPAGKPMKPEHRLTRQRERERVDELRRGSLLEHLVDEVLGTARDERLQLLQPSVREALPRVDPDAGVVGLGPVRHHRDRVVVRGGQHCGGLRAQAGTPGPARWPMRTCPDP